MKNKAVFSWKSHQNKAPYVLNFQSTRKDVKTEPILMIFISFDSSYFQDYSNANVAMPVNCYLLT